MDQEHWLAFGPFRLETTQGRLWRGEQVIPLRPRSLAMLCYLVAHPGRLVTKAEVRQHVWAGTHVTDTVLRVSVQEIRKALGDAAAAPRYVETVGRQGYRFLGGGDLDGPPPRTAGPIVGRQGEVDTLDGWFQRATQGTRQLVFVSGEAGVGKTTVIDLFLARLAAGRGVWSARGQCVEHYGEGEPYLPLLEALGELCRGSDGVKVLDMLRRYAPLWLVQLSGLVPETEREHLQRQVQGATPARMRRELVEALDVLTAEAPLVLVLEDLHWGDHSTVAFLTGLAQRRQPARLLVLGTYRPVEAVIRAHPLRGIVQELCGRGQGAELRLECLPAEDVAVSIGGRLGGPVAASLAAFIHERTDGNALFLVNIVDHLAEQGFVERREGQWTLRDRAGAKLAGLPEELRQLIMRRIEALPSEVRRVLEAASVVGEEFTVAELAAGVHYPMEDVEVLCEGLTARRHFLDDAGLAVWPNGTSSGHYRFLHVLLLAGAVRAGGDAAAGAAPLAHWHPARSRLWRAGAGHRGPARRALRARGRDLSGRILLAAGRGQCGAAECVFRSGRHAQDGTGAPRDAAGKSRAHQARDLPTARYGGAVDGRQGHGIYRSGRSLYPGPDALPTGGGGATALPVGAHRPIVLAGLLFR